MEQDRVIVRAAASSVELDQARILFRAFVAWHRDGHAEDLDLIDRYFDDAGFEQELARLPGAYAPPSGRLLLAWAGGTTVGCAALRRIDDRSCEMKRMFVSPAARGRGAGRGAGYRTDPRGPRPGIHQHVSRHQYPADRGVVAVPESRLRRDEAVL